jgi:hypothetical protein
MPSQWDYNSDISQDITMPSKKTQSKKPPPSEMIRVPVALKDAVRELSRLHRSGRTAELLQGIQELVNKLDSTADIDSNTSIQQLEQRVAQLALFYASEERKIS